LQRYYLKHAILFI